MKKTFTLIAVSLFSLCANAQWDTLDTQTSTDFNSIGFTDNWNGVAVGKNPTTGGGAAFFTVTAGQTWVGATMASNSQPINDVAFYPPSSLGFAVGDSGQIYVCNTNVATISAPSQLGARDLNCVFFPSDSVIYIGADNGVLYRTSNYGATWDTLFTSTTQPIRDLYFVTDSAGWMVCDGGFIGYTSDAGQTWSIQTQPYGGFLEAKGISFTGTDLFVVGDYGNMVNSSDAGLNWNMFMSVTNNDLTCIRFSNALAGVMCGDNGAIYRTYAGGTNWANEGMSYVTEKLNKVCFSSDSTAYICGEDGRILKSNMDISSVQPNVNFTLSASAYPNPFESELHVVINLEKASAVQLEIMDLTGRIVVSENPGEFNAGQILLTPKGISTLSNGMYMMRVMTSYGSVSLPVIKK